MFLFAYLVSGPYASSHSLTTYNSLTWGVVISVIRNHSRVALGFPVVQAIHGVQIVGLDRHLELTKSSRSEGNN